MGSGIELWAQRKDGRRVSVDIALSPVETEDGPLVIAVVQDITERRLGEESMREAYEALGVTSPHFEQLPDRI